MSDLQVSILRSSSFSFQNLVAFCYRMCMIVTNVAETSLEIPNVNYFVDIAYKK